MTQYAFVNDSGVTELRGTLVPDPGNAQVASVSVTSSELLNLAASPVTLVAAPGANRAVVPLSVVIRLSFNTVAYDTTDSAPVVTWGNDALSAFATPNLAFWGAATSKVWAGIAAVNNAANGEATVINAPIMLAQDDQDLTAGNSPVLVALTYSVVSL